MQSTTQRQKLDPVCATIAPSTSRAIPIGSQEYSAFACAVLDLCRPKHWAKNSFVLVPLVFGQAGFSWQVITAAALALACFCLWSSTVYVVNDVVDAEADRRHGRKCHRPIAAGKISRRAALILAAFLCVASLGAAWVFLPPLFAVMGVLYLANGLVYCLLTKRCVIADVMAIAFGFVLRIVAGCAAVGVEPSSWLIVCGFFLALTLGFGKRRMEVGNLECAKEHRAVLASYSKQGLDTILGIVASVCIISYTLYTLAPETVQLHHTKNLIYTVPFVVYGVCRYIFRVQKVDADGPVEVLLSDPLFFLNGLLWITAVAAIFALK
jgi:4-hydroxybenzoate polyprenyltransferase